MVLLLQNTVIDTDTITDELRPKIVNSTLQFSKCERCGYQNRILTGIEDKYIRFYKKRLKALCDECVDELNGFPWNKGVD